MVCLGIKVETDLSPRRNRETRILAKSCVGIMAQRAAEKMAQTGEFCNPMAE